MHDYQFTTLEQVAAHHNNSVHRGDTLDPNLAKRSLGPESAPDSRIYNGAEIPASADGNLIRTHPLI